MRVAPTIWRYGLLLVLLTLTISLCWNLTAPWSAYHDYNGVVWSQSAHNNLRAGLLTTRGVPTGFYFGPLPIPPDGYYVHHPPILPLLVTGLFAVFGEHEWAARLVPILASLSGVVLLWWLLSDVFGLRTATFGVAVMACQPMLLYLGQMVNFEPVTLPVMLAILVCYRRWQQTGATGWHWGVLACLAFGLWLCWHVHLFALVLIVAWWRRDRRLALSTLGLALLSLVTFAVVTQLARPDAWVSEWEAFTRRIVDRGEAGYSLGQWLGSQRVFFTTRFVPVTWVLVIAGGVLIWRDRQLRWLVIVLLVTAGLVVVGLPNFSYLHDYAGFYFLAPAGLLGGVALEALVKRRGGPVMVAVILLALVGWGAARAEWLRRMPFHILRWEAGEPRDLIPKLGAEIHRSFPETMTVQLNFVPVYGPHLFYYAQRQLDENLAVFDADAGGVIWLDAPGVAELLAKLPVGERRIVEISGIKFCFWQPRSAGKTPDTGRR